MKIFKFIDKNIIKIAQISLIVLLLLLSSMFIVNKEVVHFNIVQQKYKRNEKIDLVKSEKKEENLIRRVEVYRGLTLNELAEKLNRSMKDTISGKGYLLASYTLEKGVDPYLALSIILLESGCSYKCSTLTSQCYNVGGMKGSPGCWGGSYKAFSSIDEGIKSFVDNLARNYYAYGLTTPEAMNKKYAESDTWAMKVRNYMSSIAAK